MSQKGGGSPIPGNIQDQAGQGSEQPGPVKMSVLIVTGFGQTTFKRSLTTLTIL